MVGNKSDLYEDAMVTLEDAHELQRECNADLVKECSAKDNVGIDDLFHEIGLKLYKKHKSKVITDLTIIVGGTEEHTGKRPRTDLARAEEKEEGR